MPKSKNKQMALKALNYDLFQAEVIVPPAPATLDTKIRNIMRQQRSAEYTPTRVGEDGLPILDELYRMFDHYNWLYFEGKLPRVRIEYSTRMSSAGSYTPGTRLIRISRKYHRIFPADLADTLKHEMIHIIHLRHDAAFKREAERVGATLKARTHPLLRKPPKYVYLCPGCGKEYPRQKRMRMSSCGDCSAHGKFDSRYKLRLIRSAARK